MADTAHGPTPRARSFFRPRRLVIPSVILLLTGAIAACELLGWPFLREPVQRRLSERLGAPVAIGEEFALHLRGNLRLRFDRLIVEAPPWAEPDRFVDLRGIEVRVPYGRLLGRRSSLDLVSIESGTLRLFEAPGTAGVWWPGRGPGAGGSPGSATGSALPATDAVALGGIVVEADLPSHALWGNATLRTVSPSEGRTDLRVAADGRFHARAFEMQATIPDLVGLSREPARARATGALRWGPTRAEFLAQRAHNTEGAPLEISFTARGPNLAALAPVRDGAMPLRTPPFEIRGSAGIGGGTTSARLQRIEIGDSVLSATLQSRSGEGPAHVEGRLEAERLDLAPWLGGRRGNEPENGGQAASEFTLPAPGTLGDWTLDLALDLRELRLGVGVIGDVRRLRGRLVKADSRWALKSLSADWAGGKVEGGTALAAEADSAAPAWTGEAHWRDLDLARWLAGGGEPAVRGRLFGHAQWQSRGGSVQALVAALDGSARLRLAEGRVRPGLIEKAGMDIAGMLAPQADTRMLDVSCGLVEAGVAQGVLRPKVAVLNTPKALVYADGSIDLASGRLDLRAVVVPKEWSPLDLSAPIEITGPLDAPSVEPAAGPLAMEALASLVAGALNPLAALLPLMEPEGTDAGPGCSEALRAVRGQNDDLNAPAGR